MPVVLDVGGPAGGLKADLEAVGVHVIGMTTRDVVNACSGFYDAVIEQRVTIRRDVALDAAAAAVNKRKVGESFVWSRSSAETDVIPIMGASLAFYQATQKASETEVWAMWE